MIPEEIKKKLIENWGDKADAMDCYAEICFDGLQNKGCCYVYALNPDDENCMKCIMKFPDYLEDAEWELTSLQNLYNHLGIDVSIDPEFRRIKTSQLYKKLKGYYDTGRN